MLDNRGVKNLQEAAIPARTVPNGALMTGNFPCGNGDGGQNSPEANVGTRAGIPVPVPFPVPTSNGKRRNLLPPSSQLTLTLIRLCILSVVPGSQPATSDHHRHGLVTVHFSRPRLHHHRTVPCALFHLLSSRRSPLFSSPAFLTSSAISLLALGCHLCGGLPSIPSMLLLHVDGEWGPAENGDGDNYLPTAGIGTGTGTKSEGEDREQGGIPRPRPAPPRPRPIDIPT
ncbi:uncharacterized protein DS421_6g173120 [Arachis hypogaea]|nr:uncharacterized protein DS421_6g173120 [Arachis hypogaea]